MPPYSFLWDLPTQIFRLSSKPSHKPISIHSVKGRSVHQFIDRFKTFTVYIHTPTKKKNKDLFLALDNFDKDQTWSTLKTQEYLKDAFPWLAAPPPHTTHTPFKRDLFTGGNPPAALDH